MSRRRLLRGAGTVAAAGVAGAGVALTATSADAATGGNMILGQANTADASTVLTGGTDATAALRLAANTGGGPRLALAPLVTTVVDPTDPSTWVTQQPSASAPVGSLYADDFGDVVGVGQPGGQGDKYLNLLYSPTWATMVVPISPVRWVDTRTDDGRQFIVPGSANFDGSFRVVPKGSVQVPDMVIDLSPIFAGGFGAVQANLTILLPTAQGFASLWDEGDWPSTSSINFTPSVAEIANFTQTVIGGNRTIRYKANRSAQVILDIVGFVVNDRFAQLQSAAAPTMESATKGVNGRPMRTRGTR